MKIRQFLPFFSYLFHPLFITLYGTLFYFLVIPEVMPINWQYLTLIQVTILTVLLPLVIYFLLISLGKIASFTEASISERQLPVFIQILLFSGLLYFKKYDGAVELFFFFLGGLLSAVLAFIAIVLKYKASLHMIGISSLVAFVYFILYQYQLPLINTMAFSIVCLGLVASSRLYMKSHTNGELIVGTLIGFFSQYVVWKLFYLYNI